MLLRQNNQGGLKKHISYLQGDFAINEMSGCYGKIIFIFYWSDCSCRFGHILVKTLLYLWLHIGQNVVDVFTLDVSCLEHCCYCKFGCIWLEPCSIVKINLIVFWLEHKFGRNLVKTLLLW